MSDPQFAVWQRRYSVKIEKLDLQHREIFEMINRLHWAIKENRQSQVVGGILSEMTGYVYKHFKDEETLMQENHYPDFEAHRNSHEAFKKKTRELIVEQERTFSGEVALEVLTFLKSWWISHIMGMDQKYIPYLAKESKT